jgi:hypothetical protein
VQISWWEEFFEKFDATNLSFLLQDRGRIGAFLPFWNEEDADMVTRQSVGPIQPVQPILPFGLPCYDACR